MKLNIVAAALLTVASAASFAAATPLGLLTEDPTAIVGTAPGTGNGLFSKYFTFELGSSSTVFGGIFSSFPGSIAVAVDGNLNWTDNDAADGFEFLGLGAGSHTLMVWGSYTGPKKNYGGFISASPVPEPETYAMMLAGLGALGFLARRRQG
jgi:hypothetical protein